MYFIGLDIGTTGAKAVLTDEKGNIAGKGYRGYPLISDGCKIEQRAQDWTTCGAAAIKDALDGRALVWRRYPYLHRAHPQSLWTPACAHWETPKHGWTTARQGKPKKYGGSSAPARYTKCAAGR
jgi:hypothetical protein